MRVLMLTQFYPPVVGGQERYVEDLAHALAQRSHTVQVATITSADNAGSTREGSIVVHRLRSLSQRIPRLHSDLQRPHAPPIADPELQKNLHRIMLEGRFDVVHAHDWSVNSILRPARLMAVPVVMTQHDYSHVCSTKRMMRGPDVCPGPSLQACIRCASAKYGAVTGSATVVANLLGRRMRERSVSAFVPVSEAVRARTLDAAVHIEVIPNFVPDESLVDPTSIEASVGQTGPIVFAGDLARDKGISVLLDAYRLLPGSRPLLLAGRILNTTPADLPRGVKALGVVSRSKIQELMRSASVVVVPSICPDACPTVVLEAMAAGRPVVATDSGGIGELVEDGASGILVSPGDPSALAAAINSVISDPPKTAAMGLRGLERVRRFTASAVAARVENLYQRVVTAEA